MAIILSHVIFLSEQHDVLDGDFLAVLLFFHGGALQCTEHSQTFNCHVSRPQKFAPVTENLTSDLELLFSMGPCLCIVCKRAGDGL